MPAQTQLFWRSETGYKWHVEGRSKAAGGSRPWGQQQVQSQPLGTSVTSTHKDVTYAWPSFTGEHWDSPRLQFCFSHATCIHVFAWATDPNACRNWAVRGNLWRNHMRMLAALGDQAPLLPDSGSLVPMGGELGLDSQFFFSYRTLKC
jgi:hypothetical protein